ncbi:RHS repeat-associated core domain-containing protein [Chryseobacterium panacisoli]|uniref:RHS repeat-associated core domain-containing protein n=1 Tax=Chryseobacterium panacisoli TaxID=1807141 RepID=UPI00374473C7
MSTSKTKPLYKQWFFYVISSFSRLYTFIQYNYLNLPGKITQNSKVTDYIYRADGVKVRKVFGTETTDYLDGFQYTNSVLKFFPTAEGYFNVETGKYIYNYTDHLGNTRLSYAKNGAGTEIIDANNYYPFGLKHQESPIVPTPFGGVPYNYKYNGKELQESGMYDYGARFYMPDIGRWGVVDPLAEKMTRHSPYNYAFNNPIRFIDPDGRENQDWLQRGNQIFFDSEIKTQEQATAKYGENAQHLSEGSSITTKENGEIISQYTFHDNGTITNADGSQKSSKETFETKDGTTIIGTESKGTSITFSINGVLGGGFGFDVGLVKDSGNNWGLSFNKNINFGLGFEGGFGIGRISSSHSGPFLLEDYAGEAKSFISPIGVTYGGTFDPNSTPLEMMNPLNVGAGKRGVTEISAGLKGIGTGVFYKRFKTSVWDF